MKKLAPRRTQEGALLEQKPLDIDAIIAEFERLPACQHQNHVMATASTAGDWRKGGRMFIIGRCIHCGIDMTEIVPNK